MKRAAPDRGLLLVALVLAFAAGVLVAGQVLDARAGAAAECADLLTLSADVDGESAPAEEPQR
jgi:hypothetical protein